MKRLPLAVQVLIGVALGALIGVWLGKERTVAFGELGVLPIKFLRALAVPLVFFAVLDAFLKTRIAARQFGKLALICIVNVSVAMVIGLTILNVFKPGNAWRGRLELLTQETHAKAPDAKKIEDPEAPGATLELIPNIAYYVPSSLVRPFVYGNLISVVLLALLFGAALRRVRAEHPDTPIHSLETTIAAIYQTLLVVLEWIIKTVPYAVFGIVAKVVGASGLHVFALLWVFLATALAGLAIHSLLYYPAIAWLWGKKSPRTYLGQGADAILTGLSTNSSLATVPITLKCLDKMGVSKESARLAACVGTNLNNDGITLYEAMAALFLTQALGRDLTLGGQVQIVLASVFAGAGVAGIPEAGLIVLPLVLGTAGMSAETIAIALPLLLPVDWIIARARSGVNVMSDLLVAILLDAGEKQERA